MNLNYISMVNFRSCREEQVFRFPEGPGLFYLQGRNGAGKSTVWDALYWVLFEKTSKGLKAGEVCNWAASKGVVVEVGFGDWDGGMPVVVRRTWGPNTWTLTTLFNEQVDLTKDTTNPVLERLRMGFLAFQQCCVMPQGRDLFLDLKPEPKAALYSELLGLDRWLDASQRASDTAADLDHQVQQLEKQMAKVRGQIEEARDTDYKQERIEWQRARDRDLDALTASYTDRLAERDWFSQELQRIRKELVRAQEDVDFYVINRKEAPTCPECGQLVVDASHVDGERAAFAVLEDLRRAERSHTNSVAMCEKDLDQIESKVERLEKELNPWATRQQEAEGRVRHLEELLEGLAARFDALLGRSSLCRSWVRWFKDLRLSQIGESLTQLELEVNSAAGDLGLVNWTLQFDVDRETARGSLQRGFHVGVLSPYNTKLVPWEVWSGGEAQRLRVATQMGLASQGRAHTGTQFPLEVWDEPTDGMEAEGVQGLLDALAERAQREHRQIWVVDHTKLGYPGFTGVAVASKGRRGTVYDLSGLAV